MFRVGSEQYAEEDSGIGLATVRKAHVRVHGDAVEFDYPGKGGLRRRQVIEDPRHDRPDQGAQAPAGRPG